MLHICSARFVIIRDTNNTTCTKITLPESVTKYGGYLFSGAENLEEVVFLSPASISSGGLLSGVSTIKTVTFYVGAGVTGSSAATYPFALDEAAVRASVPDAIAETFLPLAIRFDGKKFDAGKAAKVSYKKGELTVDTSNGVLKGSFTVYAVTAGKLVKNKFTVAGVVINGKGYGTAVAAKKTVGKLTVR